MGVINDIHYSYKDSLTNKIIDVSYSIERLTNYTILKSVSPNTTEFIIPKYVNIIGHHCFDEAKIRSIIIPYSVYSIGESAFADCKDLKKVQILNPNCNIENTTFIGTIYEKICWAFHRNKSQGDYIDYKFIITVNEIYENKYNNIFNYLQLGILKYEDISDLIDEKEYEGFKEGLNYGI